MSPDEYCQQKTAKSRSSFYYSFLFLPIERRRAVNALYAFCREVDDVVDENQNKDEAHSQLNWWRNEIDFMLLGQPAHPVTMALQPHLGNYSLDGAHLHAIIDGMEMDLKQDRYPTFDGLKQYCWHVASVVGILVASIFGATKKETLHYAEKLGLAFQLTNIIRDVGEDAQRGRIYLPEDEMQRFQIHSSEILENKHTDNFENLMRFQVVRAKKIYDEALALLPREDRKAQLPGLIMAAIYRALLDEIEKDSFSVFKQRISLAPLQKIWLAWKAYIRG